ncbi:MAG: AhpC/TSA family protein [Candidatus Symbiothrix sp.]|jgi:thiol-disulfide isomerase/thioredoxin|nr:AhpC/TSA family protein [Candidatus Symbiothrix sp.]
MKNVVLFICLAFLAISCSQEKKTNYLIEGIVPGSAYNDHWVYLADYNRDEPLDSAQVIDGKFSFSGLPDTTVLVRLDLDRELYSSVIREAGTIRVDLSDPLKVGGTPLNEKFIKYLTEKDHIFNSFLEQCERIEETHQDKPEMQAELLEKQEDLSRLQYEELNARYFSANKRNAIGGNIFIDWTYSLSPETIDSLYAELDADVKHNPFIRELMDVNEYKKRTSVGKMFTDFTIEHGNRDNSAASLSDYVGKGKYVLVDFWASWCEPCLMENQVIAEVYKKYKGDKFDVLGVAVWDKREATLNAIQKHHVVWPQIIDAQEIPGKIYGINGIPHIILFGPDGTILAHDLRGDRLKAKVAEVLNR